MDTADLSRNTYSNRAGHGSGTPTAAAHLSDAAGLSALLEFERALARAAADVGTVAPEQADAAVRLVDATEIDVAAVAAARLAGAVRKAAGDIVFYSATEVGELREGSPGGSSSMPHKANPAAAIAAEGYARRAPGLAATLLDSLDCRLQRGTGSWHAEWQTLRQLIAVTDSAIARLHASLAKLVVDTDVMAAKLSGTDTGHSADLVDDILERNASQ